MMVQDDSPKRHICEHSFLAHEEGQVKHGHNMLPRPTKTQNSCDSCLVSMRQAYIDWLAVSLLRAVGRREPIFCSRTVGICEVTMATSPTDGDGICKAKRARVKRAALLLACLTCMGRDADLKTTSIIRLDRENRGILTQKRMPDIHKQSGRRGGGKGGEGEGGITGWVTIARKKENLAKK